MKCFLVFAVVIAASAANVVRYSGLDKYPETEEYRTYKEDDRYFYLPNDDGTMTLVDAEEPVDMDDINSLVRNAMNNGYWLYTRVNPTTPQFLYLGNQASVISSNFDSSKVTVVIAHGWNGHGNHRMNKMLTEAFLEDGDVNVIIIDWSSVATRNYITARGGTAAVGRGLGQFISWMVEAGFLSYSKIHLVGFSLGAHLVGNAARVTGSAVTRVTALDPAAPLWGRDNERLNPNDARYVEVIHTDINLLGWADPIGDADFYPNGGAFMPGCNINNQCSHDRAYEYMASSIRHNHFLANECNTLRNARRDNCHGTPPAPMGNSDLNKSRPGIFRVNTGRYYPF